MRTLLAFIVIVSPLMAESPPDLRKRKSGADWPMFLGPTQDGKSTETGILKTWPKSGLKVVWEAQMGQGYAAPATSRGRLFHFDRFGENQRLTCRESETGKMLWKFEYPSDYEDLYGYSPGPRACPVVDDDRVYTYGPEGMVHCVSVVDGKLLWKVDTAKEYRFHQNFFGVGSVPVVHGDVLIVAIGGSPKGPRPADLRDAKGDGTAIVAFDKRTGKEKYRVSNELASYASPTIAKIDGVDVGVYFARGSLITFDPTTGKPGASVPWRARILESVNVSNPVIVGDRIFITECYGPGSVLFRYKGNSFERIWSDLDKEDREDKSLRCHWNTPIHIDGYLYGSSGRHENESELRCIELATGKLAWSYRNRSRSSLTYVDGHFVCLEESGDVTLLKVNSAKYEEVARWRTDLDAPCWAAPVISHGLLYVRGKDRLLCAELITP